MAGPRPAFGGRSSLMMVSFGRACSAPGGNADVWGFAVVVRLFVAVVGVGDAHVPAHQFAHCIDGLNQHPPVDRQDLTRPPEVPAIGPQAYDELTHHVDPPLRIHPATGVLVRVRVRPIVVEVPTVPLHDVHRTPEAVFAVHRVPSLNLVPRARFVNTPLHRVLAPVRACRVWDWLG